MDTSTLARTALLAPLPAIALEPFTASAYFRTEHGSSGETAWVQAWTAPLQDALPGAFTWASAHTVYATYGKLFAPAVLGLLCALLALRRTDPGDGRLRWAWTPALLSYVLLTLGVVGEYWTPWMDVAFFAVTIPGLLLLLVSSPLLGIRLLRRRIGSRTGAWMLVLTPLGVPLTNVLGGHLGFSVIWLSVAWMLHARTLLRPAPARVPALV